MPIKPERASIGEATQGVGAVPQMLGLLAVDHATVQDWVWSWEVNSSPNEWILR